MKGTYMAIVLVNMTLGAVALTADPSPQLMAPRPAGESDVGGGRARSTRRSNPACGSDSFTGEITSALRKTVLRFIRNPETYLKKKAKQ